MEIKKYRFHKELDETGALVFLESSRDIPFEVKRVYYIFDVKESARRGYHAHKTLQQVLICIHGSCKIMLDDGSERTDVLLDDPSEGLFIGNSMWREMHEFSPGAVLLVLASEYYDEKDYIRDYEEYKRLIEAEIK